MQADGARLSPEDRQGIVDGTIRYCWALDERNWADLANVFAEDASVEFGLAPRVDGLPGIQAFVSNVLDALDSSQHMVTNHQVETVDAVTRSRCYFHAQHTRKGAEGGANYVVAGIYRDVWSQSPEGWRIRSRELEILWTEGNAAVVGRGSSGSRPPTETS